MPQCGLTSTAGRSGEGAGDNLIRVWDTLRHVGGLLEKLRGNGREPVNEEVEDASDMKLVTEDRGPPEQVLAAGDGERDR